MLIILIVLIAVVKISYDIITELKKLNSSVVALNKQVTEIKTSLENDLAKVSKTTSKLEKFTSNLMMFLGYKKCDCSSVASTIICYVLKIPFKQIIDFINLYLIVKKMFKKDLAKKI